MTGLIATPALGLLAPAAGQPFSPEENRLVDRWRAEGLVDSVWVRDLPCLPAGDPDQGQGVDPFGYLAHLAGRGTRPKTVGTASVVMGSRHPLVVARAAVGAQVQSGGRFVLGLGTGGKAAMAAVLGIANRPVATVVDEWEIIHRAVRGGVEPGLHFPLPAGYRPPPMWLASDDATKWSALGHLIDGWLTFLTTPEAFLRTLAHITATVASPCAVGVRLDVRLISDSDAPLRLDPPVRGVVTCSRRQLDRVAAVWRDLPVDHLILGLRGSDPTQTVRAVGEAWGLPHADRAPVSGPLHEPAQ